VVGRREQLHSTSFDLANQTSDCLRDRPWLTLLITGFMPTIVDERFLSSIGNSD
jgi:hypothetical protein